MNQSWKFSCLLGLGVLALVFSLSAGGNARLYDYPEGLAPSDTYQVWVNGEPCFVFQNPVASVAIFEMQGPVEVEIAYAKVAKYAIARPLSAGVGVALRGDRLVLELEQPCQLSIEVNGLIDDKLFLFAHAPIEEPESSPDLIRFEAGKMHEPGIVWLRSGQEVFLEGGAVVRGLFVIENAEGVRISGPGIIDGSVATELEFPEGYRKRVIQINDSRDVELRDFCISDGRNWQIVPNRSSEIRIEGVKIVSDDGGDDGIDLVRSSQVQIRGCFIHTKDDCIAIKSHSPDPLLRGTHEILIEDCVFWNTQWGNGFEIGFELRTERVHDITLRNSDFIHVEKGAVLSIHNADWAMVEDILFEDIRVEDARQKLLDFAIFWTWWSLDAPRQTEYEARYQQGGLWDNVMEFRPGEKELHARNRGHIRNVTVRNLRIVDGGLPFSILSGFDENHRVENVVIDGLYLYDRALTDASSARIVTEYADPVRFR